MLLITKSFKKKIDLKNIKGQIIFAKRFKSYYEVLGIKDTASAAEIKSAYFEKCKKYHPDLNQNSDEKFQEEIRGIIKAYSILSSPKLKSEYDKNKNLQNESYSRQSYEEYMKQKEDEFDRTATYEDLCRKHGFPKQDPNFYKNDGPITPFRIAIGCVVICIIANICHFVIAYIRYEQDVRNYKKAREQMEMDKMNVNKKDLIEAIEDENNNETNWELRYSEEGIASLKNSPHNHTKKYSSY